MKVPANCRRIGRWRIVEADLWDRAHLDLCGPARLTITAQGGEIAFGALEAGLEVESARDPLAFTRPAARKATSSMAKEPPNFSTTAPSRSSSSTQTATKPSSKRNGTLLQQPAKGFQAGCGRTTSEGNLGNTELMPPLLVQLFQADDVHNVTFRPGEAELCVVWVFRLTAS